MNPSCKEAGWRGNSEEAFSSSHDGVPDVPTSVNYACCLVKCNETTLRFQSQRVASSEAIKEAEDTVHRTVWTRGSCAILG